MKRIQIFLVILALIVVGMFIWYQDGLQPANIFDKAQKSFSVAPGTGLRAIANNLKQAGIIRDPIIFFLEVKKLGLDSNIQAGDFTLSPSMTTDEVIKTMTHGTSEVRVTIPEGDRAEEAAAILQKTLPSYSPDWLPALKAHEGYLFPDTYLFSKNATIEDVLSTMTGNFQKKYQEAAATQTTTLSQSDVVILASIVQREAITPHDMQYVASTLENRLSIGMALGSDVTIEYALGYQPAEKSWWKKELTVDDLALQSPYNTRLNPGLPPTPISNPGLVALQAVLNPPKSNYLYYVSDKNGALHFASTLEQHNANVARYGE